MLTLFLRRQGWQVVYLGANVPVSRLQATVTTINPDLVILAAQRLNTAANLFDMGRVLQAAQIPLAFGGQIFSRLPTLRPRIPGHFLGERLEEALQLVEQWLGSMEALPPVPTPTPIDREYRQALANYRDRQGLIETEVWQALKQTELPPICVTGTNSDLARSIVAALTLGDLDFLSPDIAWGKELIRQYDLPTDIPQRYLQAYHQAAQKHLDERGQPILTWLGQWVEQKSG